MSAAENQVQPPADDALWTATDVARYLRVSVSWVRHASADGRLPCIRIAAMVRFDPDAIRRWSRGELGGKVITLPR